MTETAAAAAAAGKSSGASVNGDSSTTPGVNSTIPAGAGIPFYEKQRQHLRELLNRRRLLERKLAAHEEMILAKETEYLESTPAGNIIVGFDNYTKGTSAAAAQRRKSGLTDQNRVFSRSSVSYNAAASTGDTPASTPGASHAPMPVSGNFPGRDGASAAGTPASTTGGGGGGSRSTASKKGKKSGNAGGVEDSETDGREAKKVRTSFGASRK